MSPQWIPQNIQKRLLRYILQQLSLFSEIDLSDLDVSLGNLNLRNVLLNPECFKIPGMFVRSGQINNLNLNLTVTDGIVINGSEIEVILVLASSKGINNTLLSSSSLERAKEFSLAQSRAELASSVMHQNKTIQGDEVSSDDEESSTSSSSDNQHSPKANDTAPTFYSSYVNKAVEMALSKLQFNITNVTVKIIINENTSTFNSQNDSFFIQIDRITWDYANDTSKAAKVEGFKVFTENEKPSSQKAQKASHKASNNSFNTSTRKHTKNNGVKLDVVQEEADVIESSSANSSDKYDSDNEEYSQMMNSSFLPAKGDNKETEDGESDEDDESDASAMFMSANSNLSQTMMMTLNKLKELSNEKQQGPEKTGYQRQHKSESESFIKNEDIDREKLINSIYETATGNSVTDSHIKRLVHSQHSNASVNESGEASNLYLSVLSTSSPEDRTYYLSISSMVLNFVGLLQIDNLDILVDKFNISLKTCQENTCIFDIILNFIKQFDKASKLNSFISKRHKPKLRNYNGLTMGNNVTIGKANQPSAKNGSTEGFQENIEKDNFHWFSKLTVEELNINFDAYILPNGDFEKDLDNKHLIFQASNINIIKKNPYLVYGGIETLSMSNIDHSKNIFRFIDSDSNKKEDLKFEYLINRSTHSADITVLCSKVANLDLDSDSLATILSKIYKLLPVLDAANKLQMTLSSNSSTSARQPGSLASSLIFQKHSLNHSASIANANSSSKNTFTFQSNSLNISFNLQSDGANENKSSPYGILLSVLPINYSSSSQQLICSKIKVHQLENNGREGEVIATLANINLKSYLKYHQISSFDVNNKETLYLSESILNIDSISFEEALQNIDSLVSKFQWFVQDVTAKCDTRLISPAVNLIQTEPSMNLKSNRKVKMSNTVYLNSSSNIKLHVNISHIRAIIKEVNEKFGTLIADIGHAHVNMFTDTSVQILVKEKLSIFRLSGAHNDYSSFKEESLDGLNVEGEIEQVVGISNPEGNILPLTGVKFVNGNGKGFIRNLKIEYYSTWLLMFEKNDSESELSNNPDTSSPKTSPTSGTGGSSNFTYSVKMRLVDCIIGLNPCRLHSKALLLIDRGDVDVYGGSELFVRNQLRNISLLLIDDAQSVLGYSDTRKHRQWMTNKKHNKSSSSIPSWSQLSWYLSRGFISVGTINSLNFLIIKNSEKKLSKMTGFQNAAFDIKIDADVCKIDICADSSQTLTQLLVDLKQPVILTDEQKYMVNPVKSPKNIYADLDEQAFAPPQDLNDTLLLTKNADSNTQNYISAQQQSRVGDDASDEYHDSLGIDDVESIHTHDDQITNDSNSLNIVDDYYATSHNSSSIGESYKSQHAGQALSQDLNDLNIGLRQNNTPFIQSNPAYLADMDSVMDVNESNNSSLSFADDHFNEGANSLGAISSTGANSSISPTTVPVKVHFIVNRTNIFLYDGYDWAETRSAIKKAVRAVESTGLKAYNAAVAAAANKDQKREKSTRQQPKSRGKVSFRPGTVNRRDSLGEFGFRPFKGGDLLGFREDTFEGDEVFEDDDEDMDDLFGEDDIDDVDDDGGDDDIIDERPNVIDHKLFDSIHISLPVGANPEGLANGINKVIGNADNSNSNASLYSDKQTSREAELIPDNKTNYKKLRLRRSKYHKIHIDVSELEVACIVFNNSDPEKLGSQEILARNEDENDSELLLSLNVKAQNFEIMDNVPTSTWNKFVTYMREAGDREVGVSIFDLTFQTYRPVSTLAATESTMKVSVLPLRLHVDQDALEFLTRFGMFKDKRFLFDEIYDDILYIQRFQINSVHIKLDYKPKKVDYFGIRSGNTTEFMNFFILDGANITLRKLVLYGVAGMPKLNETLNALWMPDIRSTQLKGIISGLTPSLSKIGGGIKDLVVIPVNEYKKDGRLVNSIQKGAYAFVRTTTNELLRFGVKVAAGTQTILENTEEVLGGTGSSARLPKNAKTLSYEVQEVIAGAGGFGNGGSGNGDGNDEDDDYYGRIKSKSKKRVTDNTPISSSVIYDIDNHHNTKDSDQLYAIGEGEYPITSTNRRQRRSKYKGENVKSGGGRGRYYAEVFTDSEDEDYDEEDDNEGFFEYDGIFAEGEDADDFEVNLANLSELPRTVSLYANQPVSVKEGFTLAYTSFGRNIMLARDTMIKAGGNAAESGSAKKALYVMAKAAPVALIRPIIGTTEAISKTLLGVTNQMNPDQKMDARDKYKPMPKQ